MQVASQILGGAPKAKYDPPQGSALVSTILGDAHNAVKEFVETPKVSVHDFTKEDESLADKFIASTYHWAKGFNYTAKEEKAVLPIVNAYRQAMRRANRFVLDNQFVEYATVVSSNCAAEKLLYRLQYATLPYETTWIEFNLHAKVLIMRQCHGLSGVPEGVAKRMGILLERVDTTMATVTLVCEGLYDGKGGQNLTCPNFTGFMFSLDERALRFDRVYHGMTPFDFAYRLKELRGGKHPDFLDVATDEDAEMVMRNVAHGALWGYTEKGGMGGVIEDGRDFINKVRVPDFLLRHGELAFSRFYDFFEFAGKLGYQTPHLSKVINGEVTEFSGMMRWIVCVLAMLNEVPVRSDLIKPMHTMRAGLTRRVAAFDFHRVTLQLPKTKPVQFIERHLSNVERKHKAHEVREHWRTYVNEGACKREEHVWEYDYNEGYRLCAKCMSFSRLIHEHVRGDPSLGWVRKDYLIKRAPSVE
jgi:hypothetical protein